MHSCGPHSADSNEHCYNRMASLKRRCSNLHSRILELQRIVNSGRRSIVQRNEGHCSHFNETSNDITSVHSSHLGPYAWVRRARGVLFWLNIASQIKKRVQKCEVCNYFLARQQKEPLMAHTIPDTPRSKVDQDLFIYGIETFQVIVDYYSDNFELNLMQVATTESVIKAIKSHFAGHGIADIITDNGPQYASDQFAAFTREWQFQHTTCSPLHSQSNGKAESAVKIAKNLVKKAKRENKDLQMALLEWRNTPDIDNLNPTQKLISRRTRTTIPTAEALLKPEVVEGVHDNIKRRRQPDRSYLRQECKTIARASYWRNSTSSAGKPQSSMGSRVAKVGPCSYLIETDNGNLYRRNDKSEVHPPRS